MTDNYYKNSDKNNWFDSNNNNTLFIPIDNSNYKLYNCLSKKIPGDKTLLILWTDSDLKLSFIWVQLLLKRICKEFGMWRLSVETGSML